MTKILAVASHPQDRQCEFQYLFPVAKAVESNDVDQWYNLGFVPG